MGMIRSKTNLSGAEINGILLGDPAIVATEGMSMLDAMTVNELWFAWDHEDLPNETIL